MPKIKYVLMVVIDPQRKTAIGLKKTKGPNFLIGKLTFPGGKAEGAELPGDTASRELLEETGVRIPAEEWRQVSHIEKADYELRVMLAASSKVKETRQMEEEPVFVMDLEQHCREARIDPLKYTPDFLDFVRDCTALLGIAL